MPESETPNVRFYHLPLMRTPEMWHAFYDRVMSEGHNFVVIDNLAQTLNGSVNDDAVVRQFFDGVRLFVPAGIPVVIVAHSSDKAGVNGYKPETPMGSAYISQAVRWRILCSSVPQGQHDAEVHGQPRGAVRDDPVPRGRARGSTCWTWR
jgi:hypothetical protein